MSRALSVGAQLIDGKAIAAGFRSEVASRAEAFSDRYGRLPCLAVVLTGDDPASGVYVRMKERAAAQTGMRSIKHVLPADTEPQTLFNLIATLNADDDVDGILVQLPLPRHIDETAVIEAVDSAKDVDGFHPMNAGYLFSGVDRGFVPCTPAGIMELIKSTGVSIEGKEAVVVGRSLIVGKPVAQLLINENATVTMCHSRTKQLSAVCQRADILVVAAGRPRLVTREFVKEGAIVIDVGVNRLEDGTLAGDVDFDDVVRVASHLTPVPGGVGPMTIAMLMRNTLLAAERRAEASEGGSRR